MPHAVVRWSAVLGGTVGCCVVWPGGGEVPCGVAGWWVCVVWWAAALHGLVVEWRGGVSAAWSGVMGSVGWYSVVLCGVVGRCARAAAWWGAARGGVIRWYTWVLCGAVLWGAMW